MLTEASLEALSPISPGVRSRILPDHKSRAVIEMLGQYEFPDGYNSENPLVFAGGKGVVFSDEDGNNFLDLNTMASLSYLGMGYPDVQKSVHRAVDAVNRAGNTQTALRAELERKILALLPASERQGALVTFTHTGSQATEIAVRMALRATGRSRIVAFSNCYHGSWGIAWEFSAQSRYRSYNWGNQGQPVYHLPYPDTYRNIFGGEQASCGDAYAAFVKHMLTSPNSGVDDVACVIVEAIQNNGHIRPPAGWLQQLRQVCNDIGAMLIVDATANGFMVSGTVFEHVEQGVAADIVTIGKGIANSLPLAAVIFNQRAAEAARGIAAYNCATAHPVILAAGVATLDTMVDPKNDFLGRARMIEATARAMLEPFAKEIDVIGDLRLYGYTGAIELVRSRETKAPVRSARDRGSILNRILYSAELGSMIMQGYPFYSGGVHVNTIRWCLPMTAPKRFFVRALECLMDTIEKNRAELVEV